MQKQILSESRSVVTLESTEEFTIPNDAFGFVEVNGKQKLVKGTVKGSEVSKLTLATIKQGG